MTRVLDDFEGKWRLKRQITPATTPPGQFLGVATWSRAAHGLTYHEMGELQIAGHPAMSAERCYLWQSDLSVWFDDGRFFHHVPAVGGETSHWCDPDQYNGIYDFSNWPRFSVTWRVKGPAKDYRMVSDYDRLL
ncbi:DUF6314 family protein [uncultured Roseovarius sp.]|uniref:DUF6314 family protein n=1 Tax=uncultured Roseovarius sp. TaxID=293344 RepID=UPI0026128ACF|nr:DUF6314 family protein [uncultured Roseovarius sp.]